MANREPAFPVSAEVAGAEGVSWASGMTLRDYLAGQAMIELVKLAAHQDVDDFTPNEVAKESYRYSDAMLEARDE